MLRELFASLDKFLRGLRFPLRIDDFGAAQAFRFGLLGNGADHPLIEVDVLQLNVRQLPDSLKELWPLNARTFKERAR